MILKKFKQAVSIFLIGGIFLSVSKTVVLAQSNKPVVSLGANLTEGEKIKMLDEFGVIRDNATVIEITNQDIREQLGMDQSKPIPATSKSISSSCVEIKEKGNGIKVATKNLTEVTDTMLANALLTSGVTDANIKASAPYNVTGTAALAGVLKGFESASGQELSLEKKEVAREEISTTTQLGQSIGKDEAAAIINEIKTEVIKEKPKNNKEIENIVINITNNFNIELNTEDKARVTSLMSNVNKLDYNYNDMKDSLNKLNENINNKLKEIGSELKESGIFEKIFNSIKNFFKNGFEWINNILKNENNNEDLPIDLNKNNEEIFFEEDINSENFKIEDQLNNDKDKLQQDENIEKENKIEEELNLNNN
ncbi:DUF1002 domain-containing protein [Clostridium tarantellae]|nr:DUF1002 domain-containing protein [Clostridium tarantellae]